MNSLRYKSYTNQITNGLTKLFCENVNLSPISFATIACKQIHATVITIIGVTHSELMFFIYSWWTWMKKKTKYLVKIHKKMPENFASFVEKTSILIQNVCARIKKNWKSRQNSCTTSAIRICCWKRTRGKTLNMGKFSTILIDIGIGKWKFLAPKFSISFTITNLVYFFYRFYFCRVQHSFFLIFFLFSTLNPKEIQKPVLFCTNNALMCET